MQHTPKPEAQEPTETPLRAEHSEAVRQEPYCPVRLVPTQGSFGNVTMLKTLRILAAAEVLVWLFFEERLTSTAFVAKMRMTRRKALRGADMVMPSYQDQTPGDGNFLLRSVKLIVRIISGFKQYRLSNDSTSPHRNVVQCQGSVPDR